MTKEKKKENPKAASNWSFNFKVEMEAFIKKKKSALREIDLYTCTIYMYRCKNICIYLLYVCAYISVFVCIYVCNI